MTTKSKTEIIRDLIDESLEDVHVAVPGRVESYDPKKQRARVKPLIRRRYLDGEAVETPVIASVPVVWPRAGGASLTMPLGKGDGVLLVFSHRSMDEWLSTGGDPSPADPRHHELTDAIAIPGLVHFGGVDPVGSGSDVQLQFGGSELRITEAGDMILKTKQAEFKVSAKGEILASGVKFEAGGQAAAVVDSMIQLLQALSQTVVAQAPSGTSPLSEAATFASLAQRLSQIKGSL